MELQGLTVMSPPAVTLTFDLLSQNPISVSPGPDTYVT